MKYHVNPNTGTVGPCRARIRCPFGGESGSENHFDKRSEAKAAAENLMASKHDNSKFTAFQTMMRKNLAGAGIAVTPQSLPTVNSEQEMIDRWFGGDKQRYGIIRRMANSSLKPATMRTTGRFLTDGVKVTFDVTDTPGGESEVTLLDDDEVLAQFRSGAVAFN